MHLNLTEEMSDEDQLDPVMTHREIAAELGIGRARAFYQEKRAIQKIREILAVQGINSTTAFYEAPNLILQSIYSSDTSRRAVYSGQHGWLKVNRAISLNDGTVEPGEIAISFRYLKELHNSIVRPPVLIATNNGILNHYRIEATGFDNSNLFVRAWPTQKAPRTVQKLLQYPCTAIVESIFDTDKQGEFDVPLLICIIVSARQHSNEQ